MPLSTVSLRNGYFADFTRGIPLSNAKIYIGKVDLDPEVSGNQLPIVFQQEDGTQVAGSQPVITSGGGVPTYNGSPVNVLVDGDYSIKVLNSQGAQVYYNASNLDEGEKYKRTIYVGSVAELLALPSSSKAEGAQVSVAEYSPGAGVGGGTFYWNSTSTAPDDGGTILGSATQGRWIRIYSGAASAGWFGAIPDDATDSTDALNKAAQFSKNNAGHQVVLDAGIYRINSPIVWDGRMYFKGTSGVRGSSAIRAVSVMDSIIQGEVGETADTNLRSFSRFVDVFLICNEMAGHGIKGRTNHSEFELTVTGATEIGVLLENGWDNHGSLKVYSCSGSGVRFGAESNANQWSRIECFIIGGFGLEIITSKGLRIDTLMTEAVQGPGVISRANAMVSIGSWYIEGVCVGGGFAYSSPAGAVVNAPWHSIGSGTDSISRAFPDNFNIQNVFITEDRLHDCLFFVPGAANGIVGNVYVGTHTDTFPIVGIYDNSTIGSQSNGTLRNISLGTVTVDPASFGIDFFPLFDIIDSSISMHFADWSIYCDFSQALDNNWSKFDFSDFAYYGTVYTGTKLALTTAVINLSKPKEDVYELTSDVEETSYYQLLTSAGDIGQHLRGKWVCVGMWAYADAGVTIDFLSAATPDTSLTFAVGDGWVFKTFFIRVNADGSFAGSPAVRARNLSAGTKSAYLSGLTIYEVGSNPYA